jgi:hypothetical protein
MWKYLARVQKTLKIADAHSIHQNASGFLASRCVPRFPSPPPGCPMSRLPRTFVFELQQVGVYHCIIRCVRRSMLCGWDPFTRRSYEHREVWLQHRLMLLASVMAIDIVGFCTMANHLLLIVRNEPDVAAEWSAEEVAWKWLQLYPRSIPGDPRGGRDSLAGRSGCDPQSCRSGRIVAAAAVEPLVADAVSDGVPRPGRHSGRPDHRPVWGGAVQDAAAAR